MVDMVGYCFNIGFVWLGYKRRCKIDLIRRIQKAVRFRNNLPRLIDHNNGVVLASAGAN